MIYYSLLSLHVFFSKDIVFSINIMRRLIIF